MSYNQLMKSAFPAILLCFLIVGCQKSLLPAAAHPAASQPVVLKVRVIDVAGDGRAIGAEEGTKLRAEIQLLQAKYMDVYLHDDRTRQLATLAARAFSMFIDAQHLAEVQGMAETSGVAYDKLLVSQCFLDLQPMVACSTIALSADASPDHVARLGRNLDFPGLGIAEENTVVIVYHPKDRFAFAAITWPGLIGVLSGMNEHGLCLSNMEVDRDRRLPSAMPYTLLYRSVLERCRNVNEAIDYLQKTPRQTANNVMLMDAGGDRAVVEITPEKINVRRATASQPLISTNHQRAQDQKTPGYCRRYDSLLATSEKSFGQVDESQLKQMLGTVAQGDLTMQSMIFEPQSRTIILATGRHATQHVYERIDLSERFKRQESARRIFAK